MCSLCGVLGGQQHWTEMGAGAVPGPGEQARNRRQERQTRVRVANRVLRHYGLKLSDWDGNGYLLSTFTGATAIVDNLTQMWAAAEKLLGRPCDPLDDALLTHLRSASDADLS